MKINPAVTEYVKMNIDDKQAAQAWISSSTKPTGCERKVLCWVVWPESGWPNPPEAVIGWWKHGPECFAVHDIENANHLVTHWTEIQAPTQAAI